MGAAAALSTTWTPRVATTSSAARTALVSRAFDLDDCHGDTASWSKDKRIFCCQHYGDGCLDVVAKSYDCEADYTIDEQKLQKLWSHGKRSWCCANWARGCPASTTQDSTIGMTLYCEAGYSNYKIGWSDFKKAWCCQHKGKGCPMTKPSPSHHV